MSSQPSLEDSVNDDPIVRLEFVLVSPSDERTEASVVLHRPIARTEGGDHSCGLEPVGIGAPYTRRVDVWGVDSWQAIRLALKSVRSMLEHRLKQGYRIERFDEPTDLESLFNGL